MKAKVRKPKEEDQHKAFVEAAKNLDCDESEKAFDKALGKIARMKPPKPAKKVS